MMKRIATVIVAVALLGLLSQSVFAYPTGRSSPPGGAPDAGATSALVVIAIGGLAAAKRFLRK